MCQPQGVEATPTNTILPPTFSSSSRIIPTWAMPRRDRRSSLFTYNVAMRPSSSALRARSRRPLNLLAGGHDLLELELGENLRPVASGGLVVHTALVGR